MYKLQNTACVGGYGETSWEGGDIATNFARKATPLKDKANSVSLIKIFRFYGLRLSEYNLKITCPFKSHSNGNEGTASFHFYPETNSYYCYGCKQGSTPVGFVQYLENISEEKAIGKIIALYGTDIITDLIPVKESFSEKIDLYLQFSGYVNDFIQAHSCSEEAVLFIEKVTECFDRAHKKHDDLSNEALENLILKLKDQIDRYLCQQQ